jgi:hypothetical protein
MQTLVTEQASDWLTHLTPPDTTLTQSLAMTMGAKQ